MKISKKVIVGIAALAIPAVLIVPSAMYAHNTGGELTATVTEKERVCSRSNDECKWMILTDKMSFENTDTIWHLKFNSTDVQAKVKVGETYNFGYYGWRIPIFSTYPNLVSVQKVD